MRLLSKDLLTLHGGRRYARCMSRAAPTQRMIDPETKKKINEGLCEAEITTSRFAHGRNVLTPPRRPSALRRYIGKFSDPIVKILLLAAALSLVVGAFDGEYAETMGIICAVFLATGISFYFENDAERRFGKLSAMSDDRIVKVVRRGRAEEIARSEVVVGEVVMLSQGDEVPADGILLDSHAMLVDESSLTGEPPVRKAAGDRGDGSTAYEPQSVMRSTMVVEGGGVMQVTAVGDETEIGKLHREATTFVPENTPLSRQLKRLAALISRVAFAISIIAFLALTVKELMNVNYNAPDDWLQVIKIVIGNFMMAVTLIVMAVPEGLPMAVSLALALNMRRMLSTGTLVRKSHAGETMGAITVICTDKTGTLTQNNMQVADMKYYGSMRDFCLGVAANSTACLETNGKGMGNPTESAMLQWMRRQGEDYAALRREAEVVDRLPFSAERKYMATIADTGGRRMLYVKGAPEIVARLCAMTAEQQADFRAQLSSYQSKAMRTLAFARRELTADSADARAEAEAGGMKYLGLAAIADPVRPDVPEAVARCRKAGIKVKMVTGDSALTAREVARQIGLWGETDGEECMITGEEFARLSDEEALHRIPSLKIISRARPLDKQRLVQLLQKLGEVVAVTGDGTNDAPALNFADVGLSMGSGTAVAKEASDITLTEDSFATIVTAVKWGRSLYKNIQRFILYQLTINITALAVVLIGAFIGTELPLTVTQMLWVNLIMDSFAALALASLPPSERVMRKKPRKQTDFIITRAMMRNMLATAAVFTTILLVMLAIVEWRIAQPGTLPAVKLKNLSMFFTVFVFLQFWNLLNVRAFDSANFAFHKFFQCRGMLLVMFIILAGQVVIVEFGGAAFRTFHLNFSVWAEMFLCTALVYVVPEAVRAISRRRQAARPKGMIGR